MAMPGGAGGAMDADATGMMAPPPASSPARHKMGMMMHMTFFWGKDTEILFSGWPAHRGLGVYLLALIFVLALSALAEVLSAASDRLSQRRSTTSAAAAGGRRGPAEALLLTALHAVRLGLAYLVMLAIMSFNAGVFLAAIAGHALGFLLARSGLSLGSRSGREDADDRLRSSK